MHQSDFPLSRVLNTPSEVRNTLLPASPSSLKYTAFLDVSIGGFGWIAFFAQGEKRWKGAERIGGDNTRKKYAQIMAGTLRLNAVKGFEVGLVEGSEV